MDAQARRRHEEWNRLIHRLDKAGVPADVRWRTLILYMRNVRGFSFLSERQKAEVQQLIVQTIQDRDYSDTRYAQVVQCQEDILLGPHREKIRMALDESEALLREFRELMLRHKIDVQGLEDFSVGLVESGKNPREMISAMRRAFHDVVRSMESDMADLTRLSLQDGLTGLHNRRALDEYLNRCIRDCRESRTPMGLVMMDIDHFKRFNDTYGHRIGDQALRAVAKVLLTHAGEVNRGRDMDRHGVYFPARYGGEEFAVVLRGLSLERAVELAEALRERVERYNFTIQDNSGNVLHQGIRITASLGVAVLDAFQHVNEVDELVEAADKQLYQAKETGRNRVCCGLEN